MISHPDVRRLRGFAAGEHDAYRRRVSSHLQQCTECRRVVSRMRAIVAVGREQFAPEPVAGGFDHVLRRIDAGERLLLPVEGPDRVHAVPARLWRWTAVLLLGGAVVAVAMPGSPVWQWLASRPGAEAPATVPAAPESPSSGAPSSPLEPDTAISGVSLPIDAGDLWVSVRRPGAGLGIRLRLTDGRELELRAVGATSGAAFSVRSAGIVVTDAAHGELQIDLPRATRRFTLRVEPRMLATWDGVRLRTFVPVDSIDGAVLMTVLP